MGRRRRHRSRSDGRGAFQTGRGRRASLQRRESREKGSPEQRAPRPLASWSGGRGPWGSGEACDTETGERGRPGAGRGCGAAGEL